MALLTPQSHGVFSIGQGELTPCHSANLCTFHTHSTQLQTYSGADND